MSCLMHLDGLLRRGHYEVTGKPIRVMHIAEIFAQSQANTPR
jgi:hypothetical protein